jgi:hypothetical protein
MLFLALLNSYATLRRSNAHHCIYVVSMYEFSHSTVQLTAYLWKNYPNFLLGNL